VGRTNHRLVQVIFFDDGKREREAKEILQQSGRRKGACVTSGGIFVDLSGNFCVCCRVHFFAREKIEKREKENKKKRKLFCITKIGKLFFIEEG
jgi:hypothetical protein